MRDNETMRWYHVVIVLLLAVIAWLAWMLYFQPQPAPLPKEIPHATSTIPAASKKPKVPAQPMSARVHVTDPGSGGSVGQTFTVAGEAPGPWFFEATFPIQVRDGDDDVIGHGSANAQGEWTTNKQVAFTASVHLDEPYSGPATLILLKDNPSGLPENDDSVSVPITIHNP